MRYPGSKLKHVKHLLPHIPRDVEEWVEVFAGTAAMTFAVIRDRPAVKRVTLNDLDAGMWALWQTVHTDPGGLIRRIERHTPTSDDFYAYKADPVTGVAEEDAFRKIVLHQTSYSGLGLKAGSPIGGRNQTGAYKVDCRWNAARLAQWIDERHRALSVVDCVVTNRSWDDLDCEGFRYLDPPYYAEGGNLYAHGSLDHLALADDLRSRSDWLLSYDDHPDVRALYSWADVERLPVTSHMHHKPIADLIIQPTRCNGPCA